MYEEKNTNFDEKKDFLCRFDSEGRHEKIEEDTGHTGCIDRIRHFVRGQLAKVEYDDKGDGLIDTISILQGREVSHSDPG
ncbi:MAG: hypothetical protein SWO11_01015 [Thermodesulfobacteriota bacterium]|nr:hypothetical protein [Thermodesulfobacteriota bacterium]